MSLRTKQRRTRSRRIELIFVPFLLPLSDLRNESSLDHHRSRLSVLLHRRGRWSLLGNQGLSLRLLLELNRSTRLNPVFPPPFLVLSTPQNTSRIVRIYYLASLQAIGLFGLATILAVVYHFSFKSQIKSACTLETTGSNRTLSGDSEPTILNTEQAIEWCDDDWKSHARGQPAAVVFVSRVLPPSSLRPPVSTTRR